MKIQRRVAISTAFASLFLLLAGFIAAQEQKKSSDKYICSETNPGKTCNASTTCGSSTTACVVDIKRRGSASASAVPSIPGACTSGSIYGMCGSADTELIVTDDNK